MDTPASNDPAALESPFWEHRERLLNLARRNPNPVLAKRVSPEDVVQETLSAACRRMEFLRNRPEIPLYYKLRTILFQTLTSLERKHLQSGKRDAYKEREIDDGANTSSPALNWDMFADTVTGPLTRIAREDRYELLRKALESLPEHDRVILELRHFDGMTNSECADALQLSQKNASIRYVRALERLRKLLMEYTEFQP